MCGCIQLINIRVFIYLSYVSSDMCSGDVKKGMRKILYSCRRPKVSLSFWVIVRPQKVNSFLEFLADTSSYIS